MSGHNASQSELHVLFALSSGKPGLDADYGRWYETRHLPDMKSVPGVEDGQFYRAVNTDNPWSFCGRFQMTRPNVDVMADMTARAGTPVMPLTDALDSSKTLFVDATAQVPGPTAPSVSARDLIVLGCASTVSENELRAWRSLPGIDAVHVFSVASAIRNWKSPWQNLVFLDVSAGQGAATLASSSLKTAYVGLFERVA